MQLQHLKPGHRFELAVTRELVEVADVQATDDGLVTLRLTRPGKSDQATWSTAPMQPTAVISGGLV